MKKVLISLATASLLLSSGLAFSQNTEGAPRGGAPSGQAGPPAASEGGERRGEGRGERSERREGGNDRREGRSERRDGGGVTIRGGGEGARMRVGDRGGDVRIRIRGDRHHGWRHRYRHGPSYALSVGGCRTVIVKRYSHGRTVIKRIRRCG